MQQGFDINKLRQEAQTRWLKPSEVLFILENHEKYFITPEPAQKPLSGSLFLFNRRVLRYFRKDGHLWRRKKDGRTVGEAHERLKVGNIDALNCYYAHGEENPFFQRRSYWMLNPVYDHIVLVHYREVSEGRYISAVTSNLSTESFSALSQNTSISNAQPHGFSLGISELKENYHNSSSPGFVEEVSSKFVSKKFESNHLNPLDNSGQPEVNRALQKLAEQLSLDSDTDFLNENLPADCIEYTESQNFDVLGSITRSSTQESCETILDGLENKMHIQVEEAGKQDSYGSMQFLRCSGDNGKHQSQTLGPVYDIERNQSPSWKDMVDLTSSSSEINTGGVNSNILDPGDVPEFSNCSMTLLDTRLPSGEILTNGDVTQLSAMERNKLSENLTWQQVDQGVNSQNVPDKYQISESDLTLQLSATRRFLLGSDNPIESPNSISDFLEVGRLHTSGTSTPQANTSLTTLRKENSTDWMGDISLSIEDCMYSSDMSGMLFDPSQYENFLRTDSSLTLAQKQRFSIREISPEWAFSSGGIKVIITGDFLCSSSGFPWAIMFGDIEVPLQIVQEGVLRCQAPQHGTGKVTLCVTSGNRESCSEIREFEFRAEPNTSNFLGTSPQAEKTENTEELSLLARFALMLLRGYDYSSNRKGGLQSEIENSEKLQIDDRWQQMFQSLQCCSESLSDSVSWILQELLKDKFHHWLMSKNLGKDSKDCLLSREEQGIIHIISGLGYEWALNPILDFGVGINFRDVNGWTALHWAARFGREKMVAALLVAGASAGAVTDPTPQDLVGKTPGAISAANGHKGLAGYLSEAAITSHLSSLTVEESEISKVSAAVEAERIVETISQRSAQINIGGTEDELSLKDSLAAVRNAAQAAACIQAAFRAHSFRKRQQQAIESQDDYGMTPEEIKGLSAASKFQNASFIHRLQKFDKAALSIQKKYRGWKGRKDFLNLRQHVVKIQAHVRGHQVRMRYKEFLWTVSVVEKVILRWRRKGVGLRGFRAEPEVIDETVDEDILEIFRKKKVDAALDEAVSRVLSMVESPTARQQYRRMLESYRLAEAGLGKADEATSRREDDFEIIKNDDYMY